MQRIVYPFKEGSIPFDTAIKFATLASEVIALDWKSREPGSIPGGRTKLIAEPQVNRRASIGCNASRTFTNQFRGRKFWLVQWSGPDWSFEMGVDQKIKKRLPGYAGLQLKFDKLPR